MSEAFHKTTIRILQNRDRFPYPRMEVTGYVIDHASEDDGDHHFNLADVDYGSIAANQVIEDFLVCEIIPELPVPDPPLHARITVRGIWRWDIEHGWPECHPVFSWVLAPSDASHTSSS